ncbi:hypothetical protein H1R20_g1000, partial [Candolleomyces eurysporus]
MATLDRTGPHASRSPAALAGSTPSAPPAPKPQTPFSTDRPPLTVPDFKAWLKNHTSEYRDQMLFYSGYTTLTDSGQRTPVYKFIEAFEKQLPVKSIFSLLVDWQGVPFPEEWSKEPDWVDASVAVADLSQGKVVVLFGREVEPDSFWYKYELPALKESPEVSEVQAYVLNEDGQTFEGPKRVWPEEK